ncbi:MAG: hypothetical protein R3F43_02965 [bacterium]
MEADRDQVHRRRGHPAPAPGGRAGRLREALASPPTPIATPSWCCARA